MWGPASNRTNFADLPMANCSDRLCIINVYKVHRAYNEKRHSLEIHIRILHHL